MATFVIPTFFSTIETIGAQSYFPALGALLSKAKVAHCAHDNHHDHYRLIGSLMGVADNTTVGVAASMAFAESGVLNSGWSCCASPVIVMPNRDHLDLAQIDGFDISESEANSFCDEFNDYFEEDGLFFSLHLNNGGPVRWYCQAKSGFNVSDASPLYALGQNIAAHIPQGAEGVGWRKIFNDMQLLLHHSATNQKRVMQNKPEINSLWLWGGGVTEPASSVSSTVSVKLMTDDVFSKGLALRGGISETSVDSLTESSLVVANTEVHDWFEWDKRYFAPALQALKRGDIQTITLHLDLHRKFTIKKIDLMRFWLKNKTVMDFVEGSD